MPTLGAMVICHMPKEKVRGCIVCRFFKLYVYGLPRQGMYKIKGKVRKKTEGSENQLRRGFESRKEWNPDRITDVKEIHI